MREALSLVVLAAALGAAVARPRRAPDWAVSLAGAALLVAVGAISWRGARHALGDLGPTVGFLAALLVLAEGCRREGLFDALGERMAVGARGRPRRLLALVFAIACATTAVLSLDATVVLLTPVVLVTARRARVDERPHVYACSHLANSGSLLLPVSNLTNLLAFHASHLTFTRFALLMVWPWLAVVAIEWAAIRAFFASTLRERPGDPPPGRCAGRSALPPWPLAVLAATLAGFVLSSPLHYAPGWAAAGGAVAIAIPALARSRAAAPAFGRAAEPGFLAFVLALGVIVAAASSHGLERAVDSVLPGGNGLPALLGVAAIAAVLANVVNNLPATLILLPVLARGGTGPLLAMLVGVNVGPSLTYAGSLATLLWRRALSARDAPPLLGEFTRLGLLTVPAAVVVATVLVWASVSAFG
ncbi:MAG TPA: SLC13 family permease [Solirubrobacteraceae bacterium]|nr:SLC13 family permease [Solirubrobacteraceae bacterium]